MKLGTKALCLDLLYRMFRQRVAHFLSDILTFCLNQILLDKRICRRALCRVYAYSRSSHGRRF